MSDKMFETAFRRKLRFSSVRGDLNVEHLFDLPLLAKNGAGIDLDTLARGVNNELKSVTEDSFVNTKPDPRKDELELKLDIIKHVIGVKQAEAEALKKAAARNEERRKILDAMNHKRDQELSQASMDDLNKRLAELDQA